MAVELREVKPSGAYGEILPDWSQLTFSQDLLNPGTLTFSYPIAGRNADILRHGVILTALVDGIEPDNGRFVFDQGTGSRIAEADGTIATFGCTSVLGQGSQMLLAPAVGSNFADEALFAFVDKTPGWLVRNVIDNTMSRANAKSAPPPWITHPITKFTHLVDSSNTTWPSTVDVTFKSGDSLTQVLEWVTENGFAEPIMRGKELYLYQPSKNGRNLATGSKPVVLQTGRDFLEATYETSSKEMVTSLLVLGENNSCVWVQDDAAIAANGYREGTLNVSNASTISTLMAAGQAYLNTRKIPRYSYTYSVSARYIEESQEELPRPFIDYQVGDSVLILDGLSTSVQRIRLMSATWPDARAATVNLSVNDFFEERDVEFERRLSRLGL